MSTIKLYDSVVNAINGNSNPQAETGNTINIDIQDILQMVYEGKLNEAIALLNQAGISSTTMEENDVTIITFKFENRTYTVRYNPVSDDNEVNTDNTSNSETEIKPEQNIATEKEEDPVLKEYLEKLYSGYKGKNRMYVLLDGLYTRNGGWDFSGAYTVNINSALRGSARASSDLNYVMSYVLVNKGYINSQNPSGEEIKSAIDSYLTDVATKLGKPVDDLTGAELVAALAKDDEEFGIKLEKDAKADKVSNSFFDLPRNTLQEFEGEYGGGLLKAFQEYIYALEPDLKDNKMAQAVFEAAGITDSDTIDDKLEKIDAFFKKLAKELNAPKISYARGDDTFKAVYNYLGENGYLKQNTYDQKYFEENQMTEEEINKYFYPETQDDGTVVYKLKESAESIDNVLMLVSQRIYNEGVASRTDAAREAEYNNNLKNQYTTMGSFADANKELEAFAKRNNLTQVENGVYQGENGVSYYLICTGGTDIRIGCSDWDNAVDEFQPNSVSNVHNDNFENGLLYMTLLRNIGQPDNPVVNVNISDNRKVIYYQTADGKYHKMTLNERWTNSLASKLGYDKFCEFFQADSLEELGTARRMKDGESIEAYSKDVKMFYIEDVSEEDFIKAGLENYNSRVGVTSNSEQTTETDSVTTNENEATAEVEAEEQEPEATYTDALKTLILQNFLKTDTSSRTSFEGLDSLGNGQALTNANWRNNNPNLTDREKEELVQKALEKLLNDSSNIINETDEHGWVVALIKSLGGNILIRNYPLARSSGGLIVPNTITFEVNGKEYMIPFASSRSLVYDTEETDKIIQRMVADGYDESEVKKLFEAVKVVDGKVQQYALNDWVLFAFCKNYSEDWSKMQSEILAKYFS